MKRHHKKPKKKTNCNNTNESARVNAEIENLSKVETVQAARHQRQQRSQSREQAPNFTEIFKFKKSRIPHHMITHSTIVEDERLGIKDEAKKVKKIFFDICSEVQRFSLQLRRANYYPCIFIEFKTTAVQTKEYVFLRDLIKASKDAFKQQKQKIHCIYSCLFDVVPSHFRRLATFGILKAKDLKLKISYKSSKSQEGSDLMLYYTWDRSKRDINFSVIDKNLAIIDFSGASIYGYSDHKQQINLYEQFLQYLSQAGPSLLQHEELEQSPIFEQIVEQSTSQLASKLEQYLQKDLSIYQDAIHQKQEQILNLWADNNSDDDANLIHKLNEEIIYMKLSLQNYIQVVMDVQEQIKKKKNLSNYIYNAFIKRLMMTEKEITSKLPIQAKREQILNMLQKQSILLIEGETGSGKSTQIPQILCQYYQLFQDPNSKPVLISQPRRLATRTLAERVASELGEKIGRFVDYKNSFDRQVSPDAKIVFKLDRLVLDELTEDRLLSAYSCLVIDQAHQRTISIDVIVGLIKDLVKLRPDFKVIITSASMDVELFERYFGNIKSLKVSGRLFDVNVQYRQTEGTSTLEKIKKVLDSQIIEENNSLRDPFTGHVLVFCHSVDEITQLTEHYQCFLNQNRFQVYPLHGKILPEEQRKAFNQTKRHKLIFASRIAETAITIDDVRVVVDPGQDYELVYNQKLKYTSMKLRQISQSSAKQRAGRAGRTAPGFCFRLYSEESFRVRPLGKIPEMENSTLDTVVLRLKSLGIENLFTFSYISPPDQQGILTSIQTLQVIQALDQNGEITPIGQILLLIPIEPILGRSLIQAIFIEQVLAQQDFMRNHMRDLSEDESSKIMRGNIRKSVVEILAMVINSSNLFYVPEQSKNQSSLNKFANFPLKDGDFFLLMGLYEEYKLIYDTLGDRSQLKFWLNYFFFNKKALRQVREFESEISKLVIDYIRLDFQQLENELSEVKYKLRYCGSYKEILLLALVTSFVPNLCRYSGNPEIGYTLVSQRRPIQIYGSSALSLLGLNADSPNWILAYDLYTNEKGRFYCKIAQEIDIGFLQKVIGNYAWQKFGMKTAKQTNPYYQKIVEETLPSKIYSFIHNEYIYREKEKKLSNKIMDPSGLLFNKATLLFDNDNNKITLFVLKQNQDEKQSGILQSYQEYLQKIEKKFQEQGFNHAYLGTTKVQFTSDFVISHVERIIQFDIIISELSPSQLKLIKDFSKQYASINVYSRIGRLRIQIDDQKIRKSFEADLEAHIAQNLSSSKIQLKRVPRNLRKISQSKVLIIFKVENLLHKACQKNVQKFYNLLRRFINGEKQQDIMKRPQDWREDIENLLMRVNVNPEECAINLWKSDSYSRRSPYVEIFAEISNIEGGIYKKIMQLQNTNEYLGCQSIYIRQVFEQCIAFPSEKVFNSLKEEYIAIIIQIKKKYRGFNVVDRYMRLGNKFRVLIMGKSWAREELWEASQRIGALFNPLLIELNQRQAYFLQYVDKYDALQKLENEYKYTIALEVDREKLYAYCSADTYQEIVQKLRERLNISEYLTKEISYKNKSLEDIITLINSRQRFLANNTLKNTKIEYKIRFDKKQILLTTTEKQHETLNAEFQRMNQIQRHECIICNSKASKPYRLLNCHHCACKTCLTGHLQEAVTPQNTPILCPQVQCGKPINIYDIQAIVGEDRFLKWCDERTLRYAQTEIKRKACSRCEIIIWENQQVSQCNFCGYQSSAK